jgi:hypothetical protein
VDGAWGGREDIDTVRAEFVMKALGEGLNVGFGSGVVGCAGSALESEERAEEDDAAAAAGGETGGEVVGEEEGRAAIDVEHGEFVLGVCGEEVA